MIKDCIKITGVIVGLPFLAVGVVLCWPMIESIITDNDLD